MSILLNAIKLKQALTADSQKRSAGTQGELKTIEAGEYMGVSSIGKQGSEMNKK